MRLEKEILISQIDVDRWPMNQITFGYAKDLENGDKFPAIKIAKKQNGRFQIKDGRHRLLAHKLCGKKYILSKYSIIPMKTIDNKKSENNL